MMTDKEKEFTLYGVLRHYIQIRIEGIPARLIRITSYPDNILETFSNPTGLIEVGYTRLEMGGLKKTAKIGSTQLYSHLRSCGGLSMPRAYNIDGLIRFNLH